MFGTGANDYQSPIWEFLPTHSQTLESIDRNPFAVSGGRPPRRSIRADNPVPGRSRNGFGIATASTPQSFEIHSRRVWSLRNDHSPRASKWLFSTLSMSMEWT